MKIAFIHGRPAPHPFHDALARSVHAELFLVDPILRWHDRETPPWKRYLSWILCAIFFPHRMSFDLFMTEGGHATPIVMRKLGMLRQNQRSAALMDDQTLYFMKTHRLPISSIKKLNYLLCQFDALVCVGAMQTGLAHELFDQLPVRPRIMTIPSGVREEQIKALLEVDPCLEGHNVLFIANGPSGFRSWYKGIDLLFAAMECVSHQIPDVTLTVVGEWDESERDFLAEEFPVISARTKWCGKVDDFRSELEKASLYAHIARGEAWGISILEAMLAGVPAIVSEWTGAKEAVSQVSGLMVVPLEANATARSILQYFSLNADERKRLSERSREVASQYSEKRAMDAFQKVLNEIVLGQSHCEKP